MGRLYCLQPACDAETVHENAPRTAPALKRSSLPRGVPHVKSALVTFRPGSPQPLCLVWAVDAVQFGRRRDKCADTGQRFTNDGHILVIKSLAIRQTQTTMESLCCIAGTPTVPFELRTKGRVQLQDILKRSSSSVEVVFPLQPSNLVEHVVAFLAQDRSRDAATLGRACQVEENCRKNIYE